MSTALEPRVSDLEHLVKELAYAQLRTEMGLQKLTEDVDRLQLEMREFKTEMSEFKNEMSDFKTEMRQVTKDMNRRWGELANKLGTIVEDIVAPNMHGALRRYFGVDEPDAIMVRVRKRHPTSAGRNKEFDVIALAPNTIFVNEAKATIRAEYVQQFIADRDLIFEFFPEYRGRRLVSIFSSFYIPPETVEMLSNHGCYAMMMSDESMDIVNFDSVSAAQE